MTDDKYIAPPWIKYPTAPEKSDFWRNGSGAEYLIKFNKNITDKDKYYKIFPKAPTFTQELEPSTSLSEDAQELIKSTLKPLFIKLWTRDGKPKYNIDFNKDKNYIQMYDTIYKDTTHHIHIGTKTYDSAKEIISLIENDLKSKSPELWNELKYTLYLNALYYKIVTDINFTKELIKTKDRCIVFKSDNLEWGVTIDDGKLIGQNLFGFAMMEIRDVLCDVYENYDLIDWDLSGSPYSKERCSCNHVH